jgi:transcriptional regulator with XRE-family HTH domain
MRFGAQLREIRRTRALTIAKLAHAMGWCPSYLSEIETSRKNPPRREDLEKLLALLGASERLAELLELADGTRTSVVFRINAQTEPEIAQVIVRLGRLFGEGKLNIELARKIRKLEARCARLESDRAADGPPDSAGSRD